MNNLNTKKTGKVMGIISVAFFLLCMVWGVVLVDPTLKTLHANILRIVYPGFAMSFVGFLMGIIEAFIYGWILGVLFAWLHNRFSIKDKINK